MTKSVRLEPKAEEAPILEDVPAAVKKIGLSLSFIHKLPPDTPGIYRFGRKKKINVAEFMAWARQCSVDRAKAAGTASKVQA